MSRQTLHQYAPFGAPPTFRFESLMIKEKNISKPSRADYQKLEDVIGCKWSVSVLHAIADGTNRPGELERRIAGISTKVLSERLRKLHAYGLIIRATFPEVPPRTEYTLTMSGEKLVRIIGQVRELDQSMSIAGGT